MFNKMLFFDVTEVFCAIMKTRQQFNGLAVSIIVGDWDKQSLLVQKVYALFYFIFDINSQGVQDIVVGIRFLAIAITATQKQVIPDLLQLRIVLTASQVFYLKISFTNTLTKVALVILICVQLTLHILTIVGLG